MKHLRWLIYISLLPLLLLIIFLLYNWIFEYRPALEEEGIPLIRNGRVIDANKPLELTTFNIGYAGLDVNQDFFMDGGKMSRSSSKVQTETNLGNMIEFLIGKKSDVYLLQEVDRMADRSFEIDEVEVVTDLMPGYNASFAYNYKTVWVPVPFSSPMGSAYSGLLTMSRGDFEKSVRYQLPGKEPLPKRFFDLKRCILENTYKLSNGKSLIIINVHLSAFDKGGKIRAKQIQWMEEHLRKVYDNSQNYVIVGGDWNHILSDNVKENSDIETPEWVAVLPKTLEVNTGFKMVFDKNVNTVRNGDKPYKEGEVYETIIDGFLVSPNLKVLKVQGTDLNFQNSDHQPVTIQVGF